MTPQPIPRRTFLKAATCVLTLPLVRVAGPADAAARQTRVIFLARDPVRLSSLSPEQRAAAHAVLHHAHKRPLLEDVDGGALMLSATDDPRALFDRFFGVAPPHPTAPRSQPGIVGTDARRLMRRLGANNPRLLTKYLESIRLLDRRIEMVERGTRDHRRAGSASREADQRVSRANVLLDTMVAALQADALRVVTIDAAMLFASPRQTATSSRAVLLERLRAARIAAGSLLDDTLVIDVGA